MMPIPPTDLKAHALKGKRAGQMKCDFSYQHYEEILRIAKAEGFQFSSFLEKPGTARRIYMRHDIDISLENALTLATIEKDNQVTSTYFIQLNSHFYNIFESDCFEIIRRIASLGHQIGIHFDLQSAFYQDEAKLEAQIDQQYTLLNEFFPISKTVSFHHPSPEVLDNEIDVGDFVNTYSPEFLQRYISDSNGSWKEECACQVLKDAKSKSIQILTHPFWWNEEQRSFGELFHRFSDGTIEKLRRDLKETCKIFREIL